jgi:hypothetical protein
VHIFGRVHSLHWSSSTSWYCRVCGQSGGRSAELHLRGHRGTDWRLALERDSAVEAGGSAVPAGDGSRLLDPGRQLLLVELVVLVDVEVAHFLVVGLAGGDRTQRRAAEESHLNVLREAMDAEEPALALDAVEGRVPFDRLAHAGAVPTMSASRRRPTSLFQPGMAAM